MFQPVKEPVMQCHIKDDDDDNDDDDDDDLGRLPRKQCNVKKWYCTAPVQWNMSDYSVTE